MVAHWKRLEVMLGKPFVSPPGPKLDELIETFDALPSYRMRWCTRMIKIQPCIAYLKTLAETSGVEPVLYVGLRADEEERVGLYSKQVDTRFPMRDWGWGLPEVLAYLKEKDVRIPARTDCARCYHQRLPEWWELHKSHPSIYADAEQQERDVSAIRDKPHTFRSPGRDTWPASLKGLRERFEAGHVPRGARVQLTMLDDDDNQICRVCSL